MEKSDHDHICLLVWLNYNTIPVILLSNSTRLIIMTHPCIIDPLGPTFIRAVSWENLLFAYAKTKTQISFAVTAKLISAFVFAIPIVQSLHFLNPKFQASSHLRCLRSPVYVGPGRKPRRQVFSERGSYSQAGFKGNR